MTYPYGKREKLKVVWEDDAHTTNMTVKKASVIFQGSKKHCGSQMVRWLMQKEFLDPVDVLKMSLLYGDIKLFGRLARLMELEREKAVQEEKNQVPTTIH